MRFLRRAPPTTSRTPTCSSSRSRSGIRSRLDVSLAPGGRHRRDDPDRRREHELGDRTAAGGDARPAWRARRAAAGPDAAATDEAIAWVKEQPVAMGHRRSCSSPDDTVAPMRSRCCLRYPGMAWCSSTDPARCSAPSRPRASRRRWPTRGSATCSAAAAPSLDGADRRIREARLRPARRGGPGLRAGRRGRHAGRHREPAQRRPRRRSTARARRPRAVCGSPPRSGSTATWRRKASRARGRSASTCSCSTRRTGTRRACCARSSGGGARPRAADRRGQRRHRRGRAGPRRCRRRHPQGRRRAGRDVHDADDDGGRASAVLRGARDRGGRARARRARLGGRRRALPARRRARAGRRREHP